MSSADIVLLDTANHHNHEQRDSSSLVVEDHLKPVVHSDISALQEPTTIDSQDPEPPDWTEHPPAQVSKPPPTKERKRRKPSRSIYRPAYSTVSSTNASSKSKRSRKSKDLQSARDRTSSKKKRQPSRNVEYKSARDSRGPLYRRPRADESRRIQRQTSKSGPLQDRMRQLVSPSLLSVLSALTGGTESSSGSNTTVTQTSYDWTKHPSSTSARRRREHSRSTSYSAYGKDRQLPTSGPLRQSIDVFKFLEEDPTEQSDQGLAWSPPSGSISKDEGSGPTYSETQAAHAEPRNVIPEIGSVQEEAPYPDLLHSDSGVSVGGDSPDFKRRTSILNYQPPSVESAPEIEPPEAEPKIDVPFDDASYNDDASSTVIGRAYPSTAFQGQHSLTPSPRPHGYTLYQTPTWSPLPIERRNSTVTITGYELLASKLSAVASRKPSKGEFILPLYRRFEPLHHRVLLHLQDEICELEEQLRQLDECIAQSQPSVDGVIRPASRREDVRFGDGLRYQRTDLLGRICMKLTTYNQALKAYTSAMQDTEDAEEKDIDSYREWLERNQPISKRESDFLDHNTDLMRISSLQVRGGPTDVKEPRQTPTPVSDTVPIVKPATTAKWAIAGPPAALLLTFIAFLFIPTLFGRLVVLSILATVGYVLLHLAQVDDWMSGQEIACCMGIYIGVMATIAGALQ